MCVDPGRTPSEGAIKASGPEGHLVWMTPLGSALEGNLKPLLQRLQCSTRRQRRQLSLLNWQGLLVLSRPSSRKEGTKVLNQWDAAVAIRVGM